jgi:alkaline phosphatase
MDFVRNRRASAPALAVTLALLALLPQPALSGWRPLPRVRNVILLIPDGCSEGVVTLARWYRNGPLALDAMQAGAVRTHSADQLITDSAAAASAYATGVKTLNGAIAVAPPQDAMFRPASLKWGSYQPLATVLEAARRSGRAVGLVATCDVTEATPAAFASHGTARRNRGDLLRQLVHQNLDVVLGGGAAALSSAGGQDLRAVLQRRGCAWVTTRDELARLGSGQVWGLFAAGSLAPTLDRPDLAPTEPTLAEMTRQAIRLLSRDADGFFLMVEGSQIDWACHANDPAMAATEFLAFDDAAGAALAFAAADGHTLVLACPDHDTGGLAIGARDRPKPKSVEDLVAPLWQMRLSAAGIERKLAGSRNPDDVAAQIDAWWSIRITPAEAAAITNAIAHGLRPAYAIGDVVSRGHLPVVWATSDHTATDVPLWSFGPARPTGVLDNTEVAGVIARALEIDLAATTAELFVDATTQVPGAALDATDAANPVLRLGRATVPLNGDLLMLDGRTYPLGGVAVSIGPTGRTYLPRLPDKLLQACLK